jgi:hypothetical protein
MLWESSIRVADILQKDTGEKRYVQEGNSVANGLIAWQTSRYLLDQIPLEKGSAGNIILKLASKDQDCIREVSRIRGKCESQVSQFSINPPDNIYIAVLHIPSLMSIPNPFYKQGSIFLQIISIETIFWIFLLSVTCVNLLKIRKKIVNSNLLMYSMLFILIFMLGSAYLEINVGTWVRHRTLLLAPSLSIIATAKRIMPLQLISGLKIKL